MLTAKTAGGAGAARRALHLGKIVLGTPFPNNDLIISQLKAKRSESLGLTPLSLFTLYLSKGAV